MASLGIGKQVTSLSKQEIAEYLVSLYQNFEQNKQNIINKIDFFINKYEIENTIQIFTTTKKYELAHPDLGYFVEGHALINEIRELLGLEEIIYNIGIVDEIEQKFNEVQINEKELSSMMRARGSEKAALLSKVENIKELLDKHQDQISENQEDITENFFKFYNIIKNKVIENGDNFNAGYAFEAYGLFSFENGKFKKTRHDTYYNYYKASRRNTDSWVTGGDINNLQYKLIRIYRDKQGNKIVSSASVTSGRIITETLSELKQLLLNYNTFSTKDIMLFLGKKFTQLNLENGIDKGIEEEIDKIFTEFEKT